MFVGLAQDAIGWIVDLKRTEGQEDGEQQGASYDEGKWVASR